MVFDRTRDPEAVNIHLTGLTNVINLRGGFDGLPLFLVQIVCLYVPLFRSTQNVQVLIYSRAVRILPML